MSAKTCRLACFLCVLLGGIAVAGAVESVTLRKGALDAIYPGNGEGDNGIDNGSRLSVEDLTANRYQLEDMKEAYEKLRRDAEVLYKAKPKLEDEELISLVDQTADALANVVYNAADNLSKNNRMTTAMELETARRRLRELLAKIEPDPGPQVERLISALDTLSIELKKAKRTDDALEDAKNGNGDPAPANVSYEVQDDKTKTSG